MYALMRLRFQYFRARRSAMYILIHTLFRNVSLGPVFGPHAANLSSTPFLGTEALK